jgi:hypothetical protein
MRFVKVESCIFCLSVGWQKNGSFGFCEALACVSGKTNVPFCAVGFSGHCNVVSEFTVGRVGLPLTDIQLAKLPLYKCINFNPTKMVAGRTFL